MKRRISPAVKKLKDQSNERRIALANAKMERVLDHSLYLLELHANNSFVVYSPILARQIPTSYAANAFNVFQRGMHQIEIVRLCALWDSPDLQKENIPTVIELKDDADVIHGLAEETRKQWAEQPVAHVPSEDDDPELAAMVQQALIQSNVSFGKQQAATAVAELGQAINVARDILASDTLLKVMNLRDKHLAHSLEATHREKHGPIEAMQYGDENRLLRSSLPIIEKLLCWVNGKSFSIANSEKIDNENAQALWEGCKFKVLR